MTAMISERERRQADRLLARTSCGDPALEHEAADELARWAGDDIERTAYLGDVRIADRLLDAAAPALRRRYPRRASVPVARRWHGPLGRGVAVCAMLMAFAGGVWWLDPTLSRTTLSTGIGEVRTATLSDGSRITLNTASRIETVIRLRSRETTLSTGEALFEVSPSAIRPFQVVAGDAHVRVVGTKFNVRRTEHGVRVTVIEGKVAVRTPQNEAVTLTQGQELEAVGGNIAVAHVKNLDSVAAWNEGRLVFDDVPLSQALAEAQRYRRAQIVLSDATAGSMRITGAFPTNDPDRLLKLLPEVFPVEVDFQADGTARIVSRKSKPPEPAVNREFLAPTLLTPPSD